MPNFTQGKWKFNEHVSIITSDTERGHECIASPFLPTKDFPYPTLQETIANGRLIAHAPEMYELLLDCAEFLEERSMLQCEGCSEFAALLQDKVDALIGLIDGKEGD